MLSKQPPSWISSLFFNDSNITKINKRILKSPDKAKITSRKLSLLIRINFGTFPTFEKHACQNMVAMGTTSFKNDEG
jgi:hypothetical protein